MATSRICSIPECGKRVVGFGYCCKHYKRYKRHGDPFGGGIPRGSTRLFLDAALAWEDRDQCLVWPFARTTGYGVIRIGGRNYIVSRIICERIHGVPPTPQHEAAHSCGNGHLGCINPHHLRWATSKENSEDMVAAGKSLRGTRSPMAKIDEAAVRKIRELRGIIPQKVIARKFGIKVPHVSEIQRRSSWAWLD